MKMNMKRILAGAFAVGVLVQPMPARAMQESMAYVAPMYTLSGFFIILSAGCVIKWLKGDFDIPEIAKNMVGTSEEIQVHEVQSQTKAFPKPIDVRIEMLKKNYLKQQKDNAHYKIQIIQE